MKRKPAQNADLEKDIDTSQKSVTFSESVNLSLITLPYDGFSRATQLLPFIGIGLSTLWKWSNDGRFPKSIKLSPTVTVWRNKDVHDWLNQQSQLAGVPASNDDNNMGGVA